MSTSITNAGLGPRPSSAPPVAPLHEYGVHRPTILVLDDDSGVRESLGRYLEMSGFGVVRAATAGQAIEILQAAVLDAFVLDVRLPEHRSGLEVLEHVRFDEEGPDRPVILLTGQVLTEEEEALVRRYQAYVFYKPHGFRELAAHLRQVCGVEPLSRT